MGLGSAMARERVSAETSSFITQQTAIWRFLPSCSLRIQQSPSNVQQISESCIDLEPVQVLPQAAGQKLRSPCILVVSPESRRCLLLHVPSRVLVSDVSDSMGKFGVL